MTDGSHALVAKSIAEWMDQLERSVKTLRLKNGGADPLTMRHAFDVDPYAFGEFAEARIALWPHTQGGVPDGLIDAARPFLPSSGEAIT